MELPIVGAAPAERADAARNRRKILDAAARLVAAKGAGGLTMDEVAAAARVGVGTVYRRFADRGVLAQALLNEQEQRFQHAFLHGPPPLGPGAAPRDRVRAFLHAFVDRLEEEATLLVVAETNTPDARFTSGAYGVHHTHLASLLGEIRPDADRHYLADALLAPLAAAQFLHQRRTMSVARVKAGLDDLLAGNVDPGFAGSTTERDPDRKVY